MRKFYHFRQNNSGGNWVLNESLGVEVYIEADSADEANSRALQVNIYFDGCRDGEDCSCCGDRWHRVDEGGYNTIRDKRREGDIVFNTIEEYVAHRVSQDHWWGDPMAVIHYKDGTKKVFNKNIK